MPFIREIPRGLFIGDAGKRPAEVEWLIDPQLSLYKYDDQEELERNAVAMRKRAAGKFEYIELLDEDFRAIGLTPVVDDQGAALGPPLDFVAGRGGHGALDPRALAEEVSAIVVVEVGEQQHRILGQPSLVVIRS